MAELELGRLLRLKAMIDASVEESSPRASLRASVEAYERLRGEVVSLVIGTPLESEIDRLLPEGVMAAELAEELSQATGSFGVPRAEAEGRRAQMLLRQLGGWVQGLIEEQLLAERIAADAEAKARLEGRRLGFSPE